MTRRWPNATMHLLITVQWLGAAYFDLKIKGKNPLRIPNQFTIFTATFSCSCVLTHKAKNDLLGSWCRGCLQRGGCNTGW